MPAMTPQDCLKKAMDGYTGFIGEFTRETQYTANDSPPGPNFWQLGCAFDTMLDYAWLLSYAHEKGIAGAQPMATADLKTLMNAARQGYEYGIGGNVAVWYDDWSWYGIAGSKAFDPEYVDFFRQGEQLEFFQNVALDMWGLVDHGDYQSVADRIPAEAWYPEATWVNNGGQLPDDKDEWLSYGHWLSNDGLAKRAQYHRGTTHTWKNIEATRNTADDQYAFFTTPGPNWAKPRFDGGAWQYDMYRSPLNLQCWDGNVTQHPNPAELGSPFQGPFQFTLMTGLYVVLAQRLAQAAKIKDQLSLTPAVSARLGYPAPYEFGAASAFSFIDNWSAVDQGDYSWVRKDSDPSMLFRERVPTYAESPAEIRTDLRPLIVDGYPIVPGFDPQYFWSGDQGLYLGALVANGRLDQAKALVAGISKWLTSRKLKNVVLAFTPSSFPDHGDYYSGSGIFWRYVLHACRTSPAFREAIIKQVSDDPDDNIVVASAANPYPYPYPDPPPPPPPPPPPDPNDKPNALFEPFNAVAVEIAACYILNEAKGKNAAKQPWWKTLLPF